MHPLCSVDTCLVHPSCPWRTRTMHGQVLLLLYHQCMAQGSHHDGDQCWALLQHMLPVKQRSTQKQPCVGSMGLPELLGAAVGARGRLEASTEPSTTTSPAALAWLGCGCRASIICETNPPALHHHLSLIMLISKPLLSDDTTALIS